MPTTQGALKRWKKRAESGAQCDLQAGLQGYIGDTTNPRPSDTMMRLTLTKGDEASVWNQIMKTTTSQNGTPTTQPTVADLIKVKLGAFKHTKKALARQSGALWNGVTQHMKAQMLQCSCGKGEQDAFHVWHECSHSQEVLKAACNSIEGAWPQVAQLQGWAGASVQDRVTRALSVEQWSDRLQLKGAMVAAIVAAIQGHDNDLKEANKGFREQIRMKSITPNRQRARVVPIAV